MILPEVGHCHATFDAIGATTLALIGVLLVFSTGVVSTDGVVAGATGVVATGTIAGVLLATPAPDLIGKIQKNDEYSSALTLWHRDLHFFGMTPKVTWQYQKVSSNHPFYSYDKNRVYFEMSKTF